MKKQYSIQGASALSPYTKNRDELLAGVMAIKGGHAPSPRSSSAVDYVDTTGLFDFIPKKNLRRIDRFSKISLYASCLALDEAGLWGKDLSQVGIVMASNFGAATTTFNFLDSFLDAGDKLASPTHFSSSLHGAAASYISLLSGILGPAITVSNRDLGFSYALLQAMQWLDEGIVEYVLVGGVEEYSPVLEHCIERMFAGSKIPAFCGEGGAFFVLSLEDRGEQLCSIGVPDFHFNNAENLALRGDAFTALQPGNELELSVKDQFIDISPFVGFHPSAHALALSCSVAKTSLEKEESSSLAFDERGNFSIIETMD